MSDEEQDMNAMSDVDEVDVWLTPHDIDHLNGGEPVFKGIGKNTLLVLRSASWDELEVMDDV